MRWSFFLPVLVAAFLTLEAPVQAAGTLAKETLSISGTMYQQGTDPKKPLLTAKLNTALLLNVLLGMPDVKASTVRFFHDAANRSDVLASADGGMVFGNLFTFTGSASSIPGKDNTAVDQGPCAMIGGKLTGAYFAAYTVTRKSSSGVVTFNVRGRLNGVDTILTGTFRFNQPL